MRSTFTRLRLSVAAMLLVAGCSNGPTVVEPVNFGLTAEQKAEHDALKDAKEAARERFKLEKAARKAEFEAARDAWKLFRKDLNAAKKNGTLTIDLLRCEPQEYSGDAEVIGANGGTIKVGEHELRIPKGALDRDVLITMERPVSRNTSIPRRVSGPVTPTFRVPFPLASTTMLPRSPRWGPLGFRRPCSLRCGL